MVADLEAVRGILTAVTNDPKISIYLGELDASQLSLRATDRWMWFDTVVSGTRRLNIVPVVCDNLVAWIICGGRRGGVEG